MPTLPFLTLDVFTDTRYLGNPLAIVRIPHGHPATPPPTHEQKRKIAREFNLSGTVFLYENPTTTTEQEEEEEEEAVTIDIFNLDQPVPFSGHSTIGAGYYLHALHLRPPPPRALVLLTPAGPIRVSTTPPSGAQQGHVQIQVQVPHEVHLHRAEMVSTEMLALFPSVSHTDYHCATPCMPVFSVGRAGGTGAAYVLPRLESVDALERVMPSMGYAAPRLDPPWGGQRGGVEVVGPGGEGGVAVAFYVVLGRSDVEGTWRWEVAVRMVKGLGLGLGEHPPEEDPGAACAAVAAYLALGEGAKKRVWRHRFNVVQKGGQSSGRECVVGVEVVLEKGGEGVQSLMLSGTAVKVMEGVVEY